MFWLVSPLVESFGWFTGGPVTWVGIWFMLGLAQGLMGGLGDSAALTEAVTPRLTLGNDKRFTILFGCVVLVFAALGGIIMGTFGDIAVMPMTGSLSGLVFAVPGGLWFRFVVARHLFAARRQLPVSLMLFLEDAYRLGVLRQVGAAYQFRHARLQEHLATLHRKAP